MNIAVLRCRKLPNFVTWEIPDVAELFTDDRLLMAAFAAEGHVAESVTWGDAVDWGRFDAAVLRSTWDYVDERERFLAALAAVEASPCRLFNPLEPVRWNSHKAYLFDLERWGVPIVPTVAIADPAGAQAAAVARGWSRVVVKPAVGAGAAGVRLLPAGELATALAERPGASEWLLQPFVESVTTEGEQSYIFIDGEFSHALRKRPAAGDYRAHGIYGGVVAYAEPRADDRRQVEAMLARLPWDLLYARLDVVRLGGRLVVMELELIEPMLYFDRAAGSAARLASACLARLAG